MTRDVLPIGENFWNIRSDFRVGGVLNVGTHMSLTKRSNGKYLLLDAGDLSAEQRAFIDQQTDGGAAIEAVLHLHPFHTVFVKKLHAIYPQAKLYGTTRHKSRALELPWQPELTNDPACHALFADDLDFSVPRGVDFIPTNENLHFSSVLAFHSASRTLHVDDTLCYVRLPKLLHAIKQDLIGFHPSLAKVLERRAGAAGDFRAWAAELVERLRSVENLCTAHLHVLDAKAGGHSIADRIASELTKLEPKLAAHERRYG